MVNYKFTQHPLFLGKFKYLLVAVMTLLVMPMSLPVAVQGSSAVTAAAPKFSCATPESSIPVDAPRVVIGSSTYYIGTHQVTSINQNPVLAKFTGGSLDWCRDDYEQTGVDGRGLGLLSTPSGSLYAYFSVDGGGSFNFATSTGWLNSYGAGGGPKVSVISLIDTSNGSAISGTFVTARLDNGNTNSLTITNLEWDDVNQRLRIQADSFYQPLDVNKNLIPVSGPSPFAYTAVFSADLTQAFEARLVSVASNPVVSTPSTTNTTSPTSSLVRTGGSSDDKNWLAYVAPLYLFLSMILAVYLLRPENKKE